MIYRIENINDPKFTDELYAKAYTRMTPERREKADRYKHLQDKRLCVFADLILREMLKELGEDDPVFSLSENGKPVLEGNSLCFNVSHSGTFIACAVDTTPVGIDIEVPRVVRTHLVIRCCTEEEMLYIGKTDGDSNAPLGKEQAQRFLQIWTAKEAYLKYTGKGLGGELKSVCTVKDSKLKVKLAPELELRSRTTEDFILAIVSHTA